MDSVPLKWVFSLAPPPGPLPRGWSRRGPRGVLGPVCHRGGSELPPRSGCGSARMASCGQAPFPLPAAPGPASTSPALLWSRDTETCGPLSLGVQGGEGALRRSGSRQRSGRLLRCFLNNTKEGRRPPGPPESSRAHPGPPRLHPVYTEAHPGHLCRPPWSPLSSRGRPRSRALEVTRDEQSWEVHVAQAGS